MAFPGRLADFGRPATNCHGQVHYPDVPTIAGGAAESKEDRLESHSSQGLPVFAVMQAAIAPTGLSGRLAIVMVTENDVGQSRGASGLTALVSVSATDKMANLAPTAR